ncbi:MAG: hypothetical protein ACOYK9_02645 [Chlamydiia bacterium]
MGTTCILIGKVTNEIPYDKSNNHKLVEFKAGFYLPWYNTLREVYRGGGMDIEVAYSHPVHDYISAYFDAGYVLFFGKSLGFNQNTMLQMLPLSAGAKGIYPIYKNFAKIYLAVGPRYYFALQHNSSDYVPHNMNANNIGGFLNFGFLIERNEHFVLDVFVDTSYCEMRFSPSKTNVVREKIQVGGTVFGLGLGYTF